MESKRIREIINSTQSVYLGKDSDEFYLALGDDEKFSSETGHSLNVFENWCTSDLAGFLSYDLKNQFEDILPPVNPLLDFPEFYFFPVKEKHRIRIPSSVPYQKGIDVKPLLTREKYLKKAEALLRHIKRGDIYEINFCIPFIGNGAIDPLETFFALYELSPMPFSVFFKMGHQYIISASPERFIKKKGRRLISQPMKGTALRGMKSDIEVADSLRNNTKERAENIMITDLVRNDLSRIAEKGSVQVDELCGVYPFPGLFQMISTVSCELKDDIRFIDILKACYPMGSMTGAPKVSAMNLITESEPIARGPFSGSVGYFKKNGDFDMNVLIRSIFYDQKKEIVSFSAGSALTATCDPEKEYEECLLKAEKMIKLLSA